jgi:hypothetical protein
MKKGGKKAADAKAAQEEPQKTAEAAPEADKVKDVPQAGFGKFEYINQTIYVGNWKLHEGSRVKHGHGKITFPGAAGQDFGQEEYDGEWELDKMHGKGRYTFTSGAEYNGDWVSGKMHGHGKMVYADGTSYEGQWENNLMSGEGTYIDMDEVKWIGIFVNGTFESKIQKKLIAEKELQDRIEEYKVKARSFFVGFAEAFGKSDKKTFKDNLSPFFATADSCIDYVAEPYTKYEDRQPDKWNEMFKALEAGGEMHVICSREESHVLKNETILVE